jgi:hypothetical protein
MAEEEVDVLMGFMMDRLQQREIDRSGPVDDRANSGGEALDRVRRRRIGLVGMQADPEGEMTAGGMAPQRDPVGIDVPLAGLALDELQGRGTVLDLRWIGRLRGQPVVDGHPRDLCRNQLGQDRVEPILVAGPPPPSVNRHDDGRGFDRLDQDGIQAQVLAVDSLVRDIEMHADLLRDVWLHMDSLPVLLLSCGLAHFQK